LISKCHGCETTEFADWWEKEEKKKEKEAKKYCEEGQSFGVEGRSSLRPLT